MHCQLISAAFGGLNSSKIIPDQAYIVVHAGSGTVNIEPTVVHITHGPAKAEIDFLCPRTLLADMGGTTAVPGIVCLAIRINDTASVKQRIYGGAYGADDLPTHEVNGCVCAETSCSRKTRKPSNDNRLSADIVVSLRCGSRRFDPNSGP
jgi:hypothetical protein